MAFECDDCNASYSLRKNLLSHKRLKHGNPLEFACQHCVYKTTKKENLKQHVRSQHEKVKEICETCGKSFSDKPTLNRHLRMFHGEAVQGTKRKASEPLVNPSKKISAEVAKDLKCGAGLKDFEEVKNKKNHDQDTENAREDIYSCNQGPNGEEVADEEDSCFDGTLIKKMWKQHGSKDILISLEQKKEKIKEACWNMLKKEKGIQFYLSLQCTMMKIDRDGEIIENKPYFCGSTRRLINIFQFEDLFQASKDKIWKSFDEWIKEGSGWTIKSVDKIILKMCQYKPVTGSSYIKTPKKIENTHAVLNVQNEDQKCFLWSVLAKLYPVKNHTERLSNYTKHEMDVKTNGITWPMKLDKIPKFEEMNELLTVNCYMTDKGGRDIWPVYISKRRGMDPINLLLLDDGEKFHYTLIKDLNALLRRGSHNAKSFCPYCLHGFDKRTTNDVKMKEHMEECFTYGGQKVKMPEEGENFIKFKDIHKQLRHPYTIYADFECLLTKVKDSENKKKTKKISRHDISGYGYAITSPFEATEFKQYRGKDAGSKFLKNMMEGGARLKKR